MKLLFNLLINSLAVFVSSQILPGVKVENFVTALIVAVVLGIVNILIKPFVIILTLPINILTLGLFTLIINGLMILLASSFVPGFRVNGLLWAIIFSIVLSIVSSFLQSLA